jgi:adhesin/invasin
MISIHSASVSAELVKNKINEFSNETALAISNFTQNNFENMKYLDFDIHVQENLKPSFSIMSVTELFKIDSGTVFNQTSLNTHDGDGTINIGLGARKLLNDNKILIGSNLFYDQQFDEGHKRTGVGIEAISSVFDIRGNYYNAISGSKTTSEGSERALDGWDTQLDYHLPGEKDVNIFANLFRFENSATGSTYAEKGNKIGANASFGNFIIEGGYLDDNKKNDVFFGSIKFVVKLGKFDSDSYKLQQERKKRNYLEYTDVSDKLYQPVKRENKIRVVKISKSGVQVSGF